MGFLVEVALLISSKILIVFYSFILERFGVLLYQDDHQTIYFKDLNNYFSF